MPKTNDQEIVDCRWVYKIKENFLKKVISYKAKLAAQGSCQIKGLNYE